MATGSAVYAQQTHSVLLPIPQQPPCAAPLGVQSDLESLRVYPNPASGHLTVEFSEEIKEVALYDLSGKMVMRTTDGQEFSRLNIIAVPKGIYLLQVSTETATLYRKILIEQ